MHLFNVSISLLACFASSSLWASSHTYTEDFSGFATGAGDLNLDTNSYFGTGGSEEHSQVSLNQYFGHDQNGVFSIADNAEGKHLAVGNITTNGITAGHRMISVLIDASSFSTGSYNYEFTVGGFLQGLSSTSSVFRLYEVRGLNAGSEFMQFLNGGGGDASEIPAPFVEDNSGDFNPTSDSTESFELVGFFGKEITSNGNISDSFEITEARATGDYYMLTWEIRKANAGTNDTFTIDNVSLVPETTTYALWLGLTAFAFSLRRRRKCAD
jgi:hypothetical protein